MVFKTIYLRQVSWEEGRGNYKLVGNYRSRILCQSLLDSHRFIVTKYLLCISADKFKYGIFPNEETTTTKEIEQMSRKAKL